ncbi:MAG TPA: MlaD family protein [Chitinophagaceae bacterium]|nr:MlaD family protein [Chitinophagaceae bacterium]
MKISNETKVGILTISGLTILILGFNFLKGKDLFNKSKKIYAIFNDLGALSKSNEVKINGYVIGSVYSIDVTDKNMSGIVATINLTQEVNIPVDSKALISSPLVGASYIVIERGQSKQFLQPGDTLTTRVDIGILDDVKAQLTPTLTKVRGSLESLDSVLHNVNNLLSPQNRNNISQTLASLNQAANSLNGMLDNRTGALAKTLNNAEVLSTKLLSSTADIDTTLSNAKKATAKFAHLDVQSIIDELKGTITQFKAVIAKMDSKDGTLGALINDRALYNNLQNAVLSMEITLDDLRTHPKRYVNLSIFGRKDKGGALTSPLKKDTVPK